MDCDSLLGGINEAHKANRFALAEAQKRLRRAAELLNHQIQLLDGASAWMVPLEELNAATDTLAASRAGFEMLPDAACTEIERMSITELTRYVSGLCRCLYPPQESTHAAVSALCEAVEVCAIGYLNEPLMRRQWSTIEASLMNLLGEEITAEIRESAEKALCLIRQRGLPYLYP
ncbi:hypothetical protein ABL78_1530 [Leptomonas seymouri]|uniref:Uncharacterized protein n=1 Tax=Leptomonas seymouri TaxID=5684 RepID=A0A0N1PDN2_LEPSE|nr:hypothetical protein ABL78_1530 [Leptomonas seymouri]|eukprot:KPI89404.1 hypothetical protein ABL78_1530 [Leptomonas seymouri]